MFSNKAKHQALTQEMSDVAELYGLSGGEIRHLKRAFLFAGIDNGLVPDAFKGDWAAIFVMSQLAESMDCSLAKVLRGGYFVHGRWGWYTEFKVERVLELKVFTELDYRISGKTVDDLKVQAIGKRPTGELVEGTPVSMKMAKEEGWAGRNPKYKTMPLYMLKKRAASFLINEVASHIFGGGSVSTEEIEDEDLARKEKHGHGSRRTDIEEMLRAKPADDIPFESETFTDVEPEPEPEQPANDPSQAEPAPADTAEQQRLETLAKVMAKINACGMDPAELIMKIGMPISMIEKQPIGELLKIYKKVPG
jgi:hypothetical protein